MANSVPQFPVSSSKKDGNSAEAPTILSIPHPSE